MKIEKLEAGMTVYHVYTKRLLNRSESTCVDDIVIHSVNHDKRTVMASCGGSNVCEFEEKEWSKWRLKKPKLVKIMFGGYRIAKRGE